MQINLKQLEIATALKMYIAQQGINLTGKTVEIVFTSGRKDNGLSAEITIEDQAGYATVIPSGMINRVPMDTRTFEAKPEAPVTEAIPEEAPAVKPVSLFSQ